MSKEPTTRCIVLEALPNANFKVELDTGRIMRCYLAGKLNRNFIKVLINDKVEVVVPPQGDIGRIVHRSK